MSKMGEMDPETKELVRKHEAELRGKFGEDVLAIAPGYGVINHAPSRGDLVLTLERSTYDLVNNMIYMVTIDEALRRT